MAQEITSAKTARNQVPALHKWLVKKGYLKMLGPYDSILDYGAGKRKGTQYLDAHTDLLVWAYEPYCEPIIDERDILRWEAMRPVIVCANVLNVIETLEDRQEIYADWHDMCVEDGAEVWIGIYNSGKKGHTRDGYQVAEPMEFYEEELVQAGFKTERHGPYLKAWR